MGNKCLVFNRISVDENILSENEKSDRFDDIGETQQNLCWDLPTYPHTDGNHYCILHLPKKDKNITEFSNVISRKINETDSKIAEIENLPSNEQQIEKAKYKYDFRYIWFPCNFSLRGKIIKVEANFKSSTFCEIADFMKTEFHGRANFGYVSFHKTTNFIFAKFPADAYFFSAKFQAESNFKYTLFSNGKFTKAVFSESADFESSEFNRHANFIEATFVKEADFKHSKLFIANFRDAKFSDVVNFESAEFLSFVIFRGNNRNSVFNENAVLNLQNAMIDKPEKISFHTVRLEPNWFVDIDARKFVFTICRWQYSDNEKIKL